MTTAATYENLMLGERIRRLREEGPLGRLSHDQLADKLGTSRQTVIGWEKHGRRPNQEYRELLAKLFDVPADTFMDGELDRRRLHGLADRLEELEAELERLGPQLRALAERVDRLESSTVAEHQDPTGTGLGGRGRDEQ